MTYVLYLCFFSALSQFITLYLSLRLPRRSFPRSPNLTSFSVRITTVSSDPKPIKIHGTSRNQPGPAGEKLQKLMNMLNLRWPRALLSLPVCLSLLWSYCLRSVGNTLPSFYN